MSGEAPSGWRYEWTPPSRPGPALLLLHGTGGDERDMVGLGHALLPGAPLLSPRGRVSEGGMARFFARRPDAPFVFPDLRERVDELADFVRAARERHGFADRPLIAVGYSNGANAATGLLFFHPGLLAGAVLLRGMLPAAPPEGLDLTGTRVLAAVGAGDTMITADMSDALVGALRDHGAEVEEHRAPGGHGVSNDDFAAAAAWLGREG